MISDINRFSYRRISCCIPAHERESNPNKVGLSEVYASKHIPYYSVNSSVDCNSAHPHKPSPNGGPYNDLILWFPVSGPSSPGDKIPPDEYLIMNRYRHNLGNNHKTIQLRWIHSDLGRYDASIDSYK